MLSCGLKPHKQTFYLGTHSVFMSKKISRGKWHLIIDLAPQKGISVNYILLYVHYHTSQSIKWLSKQCNWVKGQEGWAIYFIMYVTSTNYWPCFFTCSLTFFIGPIELRLLVKCELIPRQVSLYSIACMVLMIPRSQLKGRPSCFLKHYSDTTRKNIPYSATTSSHLPEHRNLGSHGRSRPT